MSSRLSHRKGAILQDNKFTTPHFVDCKFPAAGIGTGLYSTASHSQRLALAQAERPAQHDPCPCRQSFAACKARSLSKSSYCLGNVATHSFRLYSCRRPLLTDSQQAVGRRPPPAALMGDRDCRVVANRLVEDVRRAMQHTFVVLIAHWCEVACNRRCCGPALKHSRAARPLSAQRYQLRCQKLHRERLAKIAASRPSIDNTSPFRAPHVRPDNPKRREQKETRQKEIDHVRSLTAQADCHAS